MLYIGSVNREPNVSRIYQGYKDDKWYYLTLFIDPPHVKKQLNVRDSEKYLLLTSKPIIPEVPYEVSAEYEQLVKSRYRVKLTTEQFNEYNKRINKMYDALKKRY